MYVAQTVSRASDALMAHVADVKIIQGGASTCDGRQQFIQFKATVYDDNDVMWELRMFLDQFLGEWHKTWMTHKVIKENKVDFEACLQSIGRSMHEEVLPSALAHKYQFPSEPITNPKIRDEWSMMTFGNLQLMVSLGAIIGNRSSTRTRCRRRSRLGAHR